MKFKAGDLVEITRESVFHGFKKGQCGIVIRDTGQDGATLIRGQSYDVGAVVYYHVPIDQLKPLLQHQINEDAVMAGLQYFEGYTV